MKRLNQQRSKILNMIVSNVVLGLIAIYGGYISIKMSIESAKKDQDYDQHIGIDFFRGAFLIIMGIIFIFIDKSILGAIFNVNF